MGLFFNKEGAKQSSSNSYIDDQKSVFDTKGEQQHTNIEDSYEEYVYKPKDYSNIPKYKASHGKSVDIIVDENGFGYENLDPTVKVVNIQKGNLHEDLMELVNNEYIDEKNEIQSTSIYDESISNEIKRDDPIEVIDIEDKNSVVTEPTQSLDVNKSEKLSIFGVTDEPIQAKVYDVREVSKQENIEIIEPIIEEAKEEVKLNEEGKKICPNCGAPLAPTANTCFLCGKKL